MNINDLKQKIEYLTTSDDVWKTDLSLTLMRTKLKEVLNETADFFNTLEEYVNEKVQEAISQMNSNVTNKVKDLVNKTTIDEKFSKVLKDVKTLENNDKDFASVINSSLDKKLKIREISGDF